MGLKARCAVLLQHTISQFCFETQFYCAPECGELDINILRVTITVTELAALLKAPILAVHLSANLHTHVLVSACGRPHANHQRWVLKI